MKQKVVDHILDMYFDKMHMTAMFIRDKNQFLEWNEKASAYYEGKIAFIERYDTGCHQLEMWFLTGDCIDENNLIIELVRGLPKKPRQDFENRKKNYNINDYGGVIL